MEGKVALVTGSTSGIGLGIAKELLKNGCEVILTGSRSKENATTAIKEAKASGSVVHYIQCDLSCQVESLCNEVDKIYPGGIDILVNNAGINFVKYIDEYPVEKWNELIAINLTAPFLLIRHCLPKMKKKHWGRIINISSVQGTISAPGKAPYATSKHGIIGLTKGVALEVAAQGITVNAISPAWVDTPLVQVQFEKYARENNISVDKTKEIFLEKTQPTKQMIDTAQLGQLVVFLCSYGGASMTGSVLTMDGGYTAQ
ncbi:D-beta-hydroxybutyrate dehydrogenase-like [Mytilus californianus]|uniref:D-beta-hydroxybutyrate dehydrogenase-like n=1 Tax=Mytilus californianus TaxID=6549 RepID=UPI0022477C9F|nr:D-beta-hydroxybutyrate dehydrogenase-like [Mytilus californianus]